MNKQFLTYNEIVSQVWFNKYTIILVLMTVKIYLFTNSILSNLKTFQEYTESICTSLDTYASVVSSLPQQLSKVINQMVVSSINSMKLQSLLMLKQIITIIKSLIVFYIDVFLGTYICLITAAVDGTVDFALDSTELVIKGVNLTIVGISGDIQDGLSGLLSIINKLLEGINKIKSIFSSENTDSSKYVDKVNLSIKSLQNIKIPDSILKDIDNFRDKVPEFKELQNTSELINLPFSKITDQLNQLKHFNNITVNELKLATPPPVKFCSNSLDIDKFYKEVAQQVQTTSNIIMIVLIILAFFAIASFVVHEYFNYRKNRRMINEMIIDKSQETYFIQTKNVMNRYNNTLIYYIEKFLPVSPQRKDKLYWLLTYITTSYSMTALTIGIAGLFTVLLQYIILKIIINGFKTLTKDLNNIKAEVVNLFDNATSGYLKQTNSFIGSQQDLINNELFGNIRDASDTLNSTINEFLTKMNDSINLVFSNTPFKKPISTVVYCTIGKKLIKIEHGLTWIVDNLSISFPKLPSNLTDEFIKHYAKDDSGINNLTDNITNGINRLIEAYKKTLYIELYISLAVLGIWVLQIIIGLLLLCYKHYINRVPEDPSISEPKPLTVEQRKEYGYPHVDPFDKKIDNSSSIYSP